MGLLDNVNFQKNTGEGGYLRQQFPTTYGALAGLFGIAPDEVGGSVLDQNTSDVRKGADSAFGIGTLLQMLPGAQVTKGLPLGLSMKLIDDAKVGGMFRKADPSLTWYRGQNGEKAANLPFDASIRNAPSFADTPEVASHYAMNPNAARNYGVRGAAEDAISGANVAPYKMNGDVFDFSQYQGGLGTQTGLTSAQLTKLLKDLGATKDDLSNMDIVGWSQKYGKGKNAYWDAMENRKARSKILPAYLLADDPAFQSLVKRKGASAIQFKGALSDPSGIPSNLPWDESVVHQELRPLDPSSIESIFKR